MSSERRHRPGEGLVRAKPGRHAIPSVRWTRGASTISPPRSRPCPITRSPRTAPTFARSPSGARAATSIRRRRSPARPSVATWPTSRHVASPGARWRARLQPCGAITGGRSAWSWSPPIRRAGCRCVAAAGGCPACSIERELNGLLDAAAPDDEPDWRRRRDDAVLELLYGCGLRVGELCGLQVSALSLATSSATVWGKGAKERRVPLSEPAVRRCVVACRAGRCRARRMRRRAVRQRARPRVDHSRRTPDPRSTITQPDPPARASSHVRHPPPRWRCRSASRPGAARSPRRGNDAAIHPRQPRAAFGRLPRGPPQSMSIVPERRRPPDAVDAVVEPPKPAPHASTSSSTTHRSSSSSPAASARGFRRASTPAISSVRVSSA